MHARSEVSRDIQNRIQGPPRHNILVGWWSNVVGGEVIKKLPREVALMEDLSNQMLDALKGGFSLRNVYGCTVVPTLVFEDSGQQKKMHTEQWTRSRKDLSGFGRPGCDHHRVRHNEGVPVWVWPTELLTRAAGRTRNSPGATHECARNA